MEKDLSESREEAIRLLKSKADYNESPFNDDSAPTYSLNSEQLGLLVDPKNPWILDAMGGPESLAKILNSSTKSGLAGTQLTENELAQREKIYGQNILPEKKTAGLFRIMLMTLDDKVLLILIAAAFISLALGLYEQFGQPPEYDPDGNEVPKVDWVEGVAILVAVAIVTIVGSVNDWQKERQFVRLNRKKEERMIEVFRDDGQRQVLIDHIVVGDIIMVQPGDILAVDGIVLTSNDIECDESSVTGESDTMKKCGAEESMKRLNDGIRAKKADCLMISGAKVLQGTGSYLVTGVGANSMWGKTMMSLRTGSEVTPLQEKLNRIADGIAKFGVWSALILFIVLFIRFLVEISGDNRYSGLTSSQKGNKFMDIFIVAVTIIVVAVPEGLPLAVTLALAFATTRMVKDNCLVRVLKSCETMGGATSVCSDKTGTLTQNKMTVVKSLLGMQTWEIDLSAQQLETDEGIKKKKKSTIFSGIGNLFSSNSKRPETAMMDSASAEVELDLQGEQAKHLDIEDASSPFITLLRDSLSLNASVYENPDDPKELVGAKTEIALVNYARLHAGVPIGKLQSYRSSRSVVYVLPFDSSRKYMLTIVKLGENQYRMLIKGAAEIVMRLSDQVLTDTDFATASISTYAEKLKSSIDNYADSALRCIATAYKDFQVTREVDWSQMNSSMLEVENLTFVGIFGIQDPLRHGVREAVLQCQRAGVVVRMVTGDNIRTARAISVNANIISDEPDEDTVVMEGPAFRELDDIEAIKICQKIRVLARSSPQDKRRLVQLLKDQGETVAVTGDGTNDAPALRLADVGFSMGISGTEVAKEASDIIIMDDNFASIVNALKWGRTVNDAVKKFLQFQLTVNVTAVTLTFISSVASSDNSSVLTAVQLLWVNLIMDTLAALALATDAPTDAVLDRLPDNRKVSLITPTMWKMIFGQAIYQLAVTFVLHFAGEQLFDYRDPNSDDKERLSSLVFNTFLWMQFFNMFVNRRLDNKNNLFVGIHKNPFFPIIALIISGFQVIIMFFGGVAFSVKRQTPGMWATAIICGFCSIPVGMLTRFIPNWLVLKLYPRRLWHWFIFGLDSIEAGFMWLIWPVTWLCSQLFKQIKRLFGFSAEDDDNMSTSEEIDSHKHLVDRHLKPGSRVNEYHVHEYKWAPGIEKSLQDMTFSQKVRGGRTQQLNRFFHKTPHHETTSLEPAVSSVHSRFSDGSTLAAFMAPMVVSGAIGGWAPTPKDH